MELTMKQRMIMTFALDARIEALNERVDCFKNGIAQNCTDENLSLLKTAELNLEETIELLNLVEVDF